MERNPVEMSKMFFVGSQSREHIETPNICGRAPMKRVWETQIETMLLTNLFAWAGIGLAGGLGNYQSVELPTSVLTIQW